MERMKKALYFSLTFEMPIPKRIRSKPINIHNLPKVIRFYFPNKTNKFDMTKPMTFILIFVDRNIYKNINKMLNIFKFKKCN